MLLLKALLLTIGALLTIAAVRDLKSRTWSIHSPRTFYAGYKSVLFNRPIVVSRASVPSFTYLTPEQLEFHIDELCEACITFRQVPKFISKGNQNPKEYLSFISKFRIHKVTLLVDEILKEY